MQQQQHLRQQQQQQVQHNSQGNVGFPANAHQQGFQGGGMNRLAGPNTSNRVGPAGSQPVTSATHPTAGADSGKQALQNMLRARHPGPNQFAVQHQQQQEQQQQQQQHGTPQNQHLQHGSNLNRPNKVTGQQVAHQLINQQLQHPEQQQRQQHHHHQQVLHNQDQQQPPNHQQVRTVHFCNDKLQGSAKRSADFVKQQPGRAGQKS